MRGTSRRHVEQMNLLESCAASRPERPPDPSPKPCATPRIDANPPRVVRRRNPSSGPGRARTALLHCRKPRALRQPVCAASTPKPWLANRFALDPSPHLLPHDPLGASSSRRLAPLNVRPLEPPGCGPGPRYPPASHSLSPLSSSTRSSNYEPPRSTRRLFWRLDSKKTSSQRPSEARMSAFAPFSVSLPPASRYRTLTGRRKTFSPPHALPPKDPSSYGEREERPTRSPLPHRPFRSPNAIHHHGFTETCVHSILCSGDFAVHW